MVITATSQKALDRSRKRRRHDEDRSVLALIKQCVKETRLPPTYAQLAELHGCSKNKIWRILHRLEEAGKIELGRSQTRSVRIVAPAPEARGRGMRNVIRPEIAAKLKTGWEERAKDAFVRSANGEALLAEMEATLNKRAEEADPAGLTVADIIGFVFGAGFGMGYGVCEAEA